MEKLSTPVLVSHQADLTAMRVESVIGDDKEDDDQDDLRPGTLLLGKGMTRSRWELRGGKAANGGERAPA